MHLVLDPAQDAAHEAWLRGVSGAYEWWYFDAQSQDGLWSLACIWFLGNPFSPYYRLCAQGTPADPYTHNALFFALHRKGRLHAYHFTRFPRHAVCADAAQPAHLRFGPNHLTLSEGVYRLRLADENANRRVLAANLDFAAIGAPDDHAALHASGEDPPDDNHFWLPAAPACRVSASITLHEPHNRKPEQIAFQGSGYHDHNWGTLPFASDIRDWYWARAILGGGRTALLYHVDYHPPRRASSHLLLFENGTPAYHDPHAQVTKSHPRWNAFGTRYAARLEARSGDLRAIFEMQQRLDSSPFYIRALSSAIVQSAETVETVSGIAEYFRPVLLGSRLAASAMKARIVEAE